MIDYFTQLSFCKKRGYINTVFSAKASTLPELRVMFLLIRSRFYELGKERMRLVGT
jgi:hypothetical protein